MIVDEAIVHSIPRKLKTDLTPAKVKFSEATCSLDGTVRGELELKFKDVLVKLGREVVVDAEFKSQLPDQVRAFLEGKRGLVNASKEIAELLLASQPTNSSEGLLLVSSVRLHGLSACVQDARGCSETFAGHRWSVFSSIEACEGSI
ncbi:hypothetical protein [Actinacidiphila rubida]|uniref:hypothetical protein n=1 Tax=Actinacidiphila rubida TaxID=310780 RepID=UPI00114D0B7F|nr:hypothetical protein [Actinacidiphila rubida]